jgi:hypothetical protein
VTKEMKQNNKWRRRIIRVLDTLLEDLQNRPPGPTQSTVTHKLAELDNRPDSTAGGHSGVEIAESLYYWKVIAIPKTNDNVIYRVKDCLEDTAFTIYCSMQDATYIRLYSAEVWREFALGSIGVQAATVATNSAISLLDRMSRHPQWMFDHLQDGDGKPRTHPWIDRFMRRHIANDLVSEDTRPDRINAAFEDVSLARHATRRLGFYVSTLQCSRLSTLLSKTFSTQEALSTSTISLEERRLLKSLAQLRCLEYFHDQVSSTFKCDYMYTAARTLVQGSIDTSAVFAAQILYDIQQETDPQNEPIEDLLEALTLDYLSKYDDYSAEWKRESPDSNHFTRLKLMGDNHSLLRHIAYSDNDIQDALERLEQFTPAQQTIPDFNIVRHVPLLIGQLVCRYHVGFHECFLDIANKRGFILTAMHLYNAAKKSGSLPPGACWVDMESVIDSQVGYDPFGGSPANTGITFLKSFCDAYGLKSGKFTVSHRLTNPEQVENDIHLAGASPKPLKSQSLYVRVSSELQLLPGSEPKDLSFPKLQALGDYQLNTSSVHGTPHSIGRLIAAKEVCEVDEEALGFDIFGFHLICKKLLSKIRNACFADAPDDYPSIRYDGTEGLNTTIAELLRDLLNCPRHHSSMWPKAMEILASTISQGGSACEEMALERMKMTTMDIISLDSECSGSDTSSDGSALETSTLENPPPEPMEVDKPQCDIWTSGVSSLRSREDGESPHVPSKRPKLDSSGPPSRATADRSEEWHHLQQETIRELSNVRVEQSASVHYLITPTDRILTSWAPEEGPRTLR